MVGALGALSGTTAGEDADDTEEPIELAAVTVNVYETPLVKPLTTQLVEAAEMVQVLFPTLEVAV